MIHTIIIDLLLRNLSSFQKQNIWYREPCIVMYIVSWQIHFIASLVVITDQCFYLNKTMLVKVAMAASLLN